MSLSYSAASIKPRVVQLVSYIGVALLCSGLGLGLVGGCSNSTVLPPATAAYANEWLELIDAKAYEQSWNQSSTLFQDALTASAWAQAAQSTRGIFGEMASRDRAGAEQIQNPPGAPDGNYWFITYKTTFAKKQDAQETLTLVQESNGDWRVAGYFVK